MATISFPGAFRFSKWRFFLNLGGAWEQRFVAREERDFWKIECFPRFTKVYFLSITFERIFLAFDRF